LYPQDGLLERGKVLLFRGVNQLQILSDPRLRRGGLGFRSLSPDNAGAQDESDQKKKAQFRAKRRKYGVHA
jgi:hypothetical protein